jgi:hypothetical protein
MFLVATVVYPPDKSVSVAKKFTEIMAKQLPPFMTRLYTLGNSKIDLGIKVISIFEVDDTKIKEGIIEITRQCVQFNDIEGFKYEIETMLPRQFRE